MKLLVIIPSLHRGGAERVVSILTTEWTKDHQVTVAVFDASNPAFDIRAQVVALNLTSRRTIVGKISNAFGRVFRLRSLIRNERPDRIISFMESANFPAILAAKLSGFADRLTISVRNNPAVFPLMHRHLLHFLYPLSSTIVACSGGVASALIKMGIPSSQVRVIPNPVVIQRKQGSELSSVLLAPTASFILGVGRLHKQKGLERLILAYSKLDIPDLSLVILGDGEERQRLSELATRLGVAGRVYMPGAVKDPSPWYQAAQCFVLSSHNEGWPNVLMEAMSQGCPVVSFDCDYGPSEIISNDSVGLLVKDGDMEELINVLKAVLTDDAFRSGLVAGGMSRAECFAAEKVAVRWLSDSVSSP